MNPADFKYYFAIGWHHIMSLGALDHLYFIAALSVIYQFRHWRQVFILVTAFTIGHAITLFLGGMDIIRMEDKFVEFAIPCTIVFSSLMNFRKQPANHATNKIQYVLALFFGLIHGMGYANTIRFMVSKDQSMVWSLFAFNVGLEIGQIFVVLFVLVLGVLAVFSKLFNTREWVLSFSSLLLGLAIKLTIERYPF